MIPAVLKPGEHVCAICENAAEQKAVVPTFLIEGIRQNERCLCAAGDFSVAKIAQTLATRSVDVTRELERGALQWMTAREDYLQFGEFSAHKLSEFLRQAEAAALHDGFTGLRYLVDMAWLLGSNANGELVIECEALLDDFATGGRSVVLCLYDRTRIEPALIHDALRIHPVAILGELVCPNPFYEPQMIQGEIPASERLDWKISQIERIRLAEQSRQVDHEVLRAIFEGTIDAVFMKDEHGFYRMINSAGARFLGKSVEDVLGKQDVELFEPETARAIVDGDRRLVATGNIETFEQVATFDGVTRTYLTTKGPYRDTLGNITGVIGIARDITESKRLMAERDGLAARLRLQIDRLPLAYILLDSHYCVRDWNPAAERIFGYSKEEAMGRDCLRLIVPHPFEDRLQNVLDRLERGDMNAHSINENRTKDGRTITCEWFNTPLMEVDGRFGGTISVALDITERQQAAKELEQAKQRFQAIFENALDPIVLMDDSLRFVDGNPAACAMYGYTREELLGLTAWNVTPAEDHARISELFNKLISSGSVTGDYTVLTRSGERREVECRAVAGILPGLHKVFFRDVTEQRRAETDLRDFAQRWKALSHRVVETQEADRRHLARELNDEIGQVLSAINVKLQTGRIIHAAVAQPWLEDSIQIVDSAIQQVRNLSLELRPSMLDDLGLVSTLRWYADRQSQQSGFVLHFTSDYSGGHVSSNLAAACYRVAQEALSNVVRHSQAREVWVEVRGDDALLEVFIRDDGIGFDVATFLHQAESRTSFGIRGMRERAELLGGKFEIESERTRGTRVFVQFRC